ncbi:S8 family serine peptidase [Cohnella sp. 56]|uniref:S8 family serine peptidase n=1 Tax=Cohnella sp. 56 TaxID=3113722 RepID=UPI0030E965C0
MMSNKFKAPILFLIFSLLYLVLAPYDQLEAKTNSNKTEYLVGFKKGLEPQSYLNAKKIKHSIKKKMRKQTTVMMELDDLEIKQLRGDPNIAFIEKNDSVTVQGITVSDTQGENASTNLSSEVIPWGNVAIGANLVQESELKGNGIKVAVLDTGIFAHPDLKVIGGVNFVPTSTSYSDDNGHGTHVAGILAAQHNDLGIKGVAPNVDLYAVKVLDESGNGTYSQVIQGIEWAIDNHINIISMSFTGNSDSQALHEAIIKANSSGILLVGSAGNFGKGFETEKYPALYPEVISVGATTQANLRANLSSTGSQLDIMAPGVDILSTYNDGGYTQLSGTSMAVPYISAAAAVLWSHYPSEDADSIMNRIFDNATTLGSSHEYGNGLINLAKSLNLINSEIPAYQMDANDGSIPETPGDSEVSISAITRGQTFSISTTAPGTRPSYTKVDIGIDSPTSVRVCFRTYVATIPAGSTVPIPPLSCTSSASWPLGSYIVKYTFYYSGGLVQSSSTFTVLPEAPILQFISATPYSIKMSWNAINGVGNYKLIVNGSTILSLGNVTNYQYTGLTPGTTYLLQIKAEDPTNPNSVATSSAVPMRTLDPGTVLIEYHYSPVGRLEYILYPNGKKLVFNYDKNGNVISKNWTLVP